MKRWIKYYLLSIVIYVIVNVILYTQVGSIIDWTIYVLSFLTAYGVIAWFEDKERR